MRASELFGARTVKRIRNVLATVLLLLVGAAAHAAPAAQPPALVSILDGEAALLRDSGRFGAAEGVRLAAGDLLETGPQTRLLRLEFTDGAIVDLGPSTRALVAPRLGMRGQAAAAHVYVLQGWFKLIQPAGGAPVPAGVLTPAYALGEPAGQQVAAVDADGGFQLFCEAGAVALQDRAARPAPPPVRLKAGEFFARRGSGKAAVAPRPTPAFIQSVPRSFLDPLPTRAALFKGREVAPRRLGDLAYTDAAAWLAAEPMLRSHFASRWRALARRPDFRAGLVEHMREHPEWDRIVFPEKYRPKPPAQAPAAPPRPAGVRTY